MRSVADLLEELRAGGGESSRIEVKRGLGESALETVSAFSNEPDLGGGYLLFGATEAARGGEFDVVGVPHPDRLQADLASQCRQVFNRPVRPGLSVQEVEGKAVVVAYIAEAEPGDKPIFIEKKGMQCGAYRRIGSTDQRCSEDDLRILLRESQRMTFELTPVQYSSVDDLDPDAVEHYRQLLVRAVPDTRLREAARNELLQSIAAVVPEGGTLVPTVAGVVLFGTWEALRRLLPTVRIDCVRVAGAEWVPSPDRRYDAAIEIRAPLLVAFQRVFREVVDSLPRRFELRPGDPRRVDAPPIPEAAIREVLVNALMHRDYRQNEAILVIRYTDRVEVRNPGHSLVAEDDFGDPASRTRNPRLANVFRDVQYAETKGTGIRAVRQAMAEAKLEPPVFNSSRASNRFVATLWLQDLVQLLQEPGQLRRSGPGARSPGAPRERAGLRRGRALPRRAHPLAEPQGERTRLAEPRD